MPNSLTHLGRRDRPHGHFVTDIPVNEVPLRRFVVSGNPELSARLQAIVPVLEIFNALSVTQAGMHAPTLSTLTAADGSTRQVQTWTLFAEQVQPMLDAYEQLRQSVYGALVMQTRLKPCLDSVDLLCEFPLDIVESNNLIWRLCA